MLAYNRVDHYVESFRRNNTKDYWFILAQNQKISMDAYQYSHQTWLLELSSRLIPLIFKCSIDENEMFLKKFKLQTNFVCESMQ